MPNKLTEFIPNKMFNTIKLFFIKYWLHIKRKLNLTVVNIRLLHYHISQQTQQINMINAENIYINFKAINNVLDAKMVDNNNIIYIGR